jgi:hypothetical protein
MDQDSVLEPAEVLERSLEEPPIKRRLTWLKENSTRSRETCSPFQELSEKEKGHKGLQVMFALVSNLNDTEPSLFDEANKLQV